jgi:hypothetical protein
MELKSSELSVAEEVWDQRPETEADEMERVVCHLVDTLAYLVYTLAYLVYTRAHLVDTLAYVVDTFIWLTFLLGCFSD